MSNLYRNKKLNDCPVQTIFVKHTRSARTKIPVYFHVHIWKNHIVTVNIYFHKLSICHGNLSH